MTRKLIRIILGGFSLTSAMFIFQACYGTPQDFGLDVLVEGQVKAKATGLPIKGINVNLVNKAQYGYTDDEGKFSLYTELTDNLIIRFKDIDSTLNGSFASMDTVLTNVDDNVYLDITLEEE